MCVCVCVLHAYLYISINSRDFRRNFLRYQVYMSEVSFGTFLVSSLKLQDQILATFGMNSKGLWDGINNSKIV